MVVVTAVVVAAVGVTLWKAGWSPSREARPPFVDLKARLIVDENRACRLVNDGDPMRNVELMHGSWVVNTKSREMMGGEPGQDTRMAAKGDLGFAEQLAATLPDFALFNLCRRIGLPEGCGRSEDCVALFACAAQFQRADGRRWEMQQLLASPLSDDGSCKLTQVHVDFLEDDKPFDRAIKEALSTIDEKRGAHEFLRQGLQRSIGPRVREVSGDRIVPPSQVTSATPLSNAPIGDRAEARDPNAEKGPPAPLNVSGVAGDVVVSQGQTGGITAHTVNNLSDKRLIATLVLRVAIETETTETPPSDVETSAGLASAAALFTKEKRRIRFATDFMSRQQQLTPTTRRLVLEYQPETKDEVLGKPLEILENVDVLVVNYSDFFRQLGFPTTHRTTFTCDVVVNGVVVGTITATGDFADGQRGLSVGEVFALVPAKYAAAVEAP
ncbi:MAG: hypothetical protein HYS27_02480 [Deltaproteobacteria bacterium]|nr:hypothetical protein [Deltaproteobacteria bacterium]